MLTHQSQKIFTRAEHDPEKITPMQPNTATVPSIRAMSPNWARQILPRIGAHWLLKSIGTAAYMSVFFIAYFQLMRHPSSSVTVMPVTAIDELVPFQPSALIPYFSLWLYVSLPAALILDRRELIGYGWWLAGMCVAGLACFYFWPTTVLLPIAEWSKHPSFGILQGVDAAANACPSMHVAAAMFSACWLNHNLRDMGAPPKVRLFNWLWLIAIAYSTMAIKQHVFIDVIAGLALALVFALPSLKYRWSRRVDQA